MPDFPDKAFFENLEQSLLHTDWRDSEAALNKLLAVEFEEIGSDGLCNSRDEVVAWLLTKSSAMRWQLDQTRLTRISRETALFIYRARQIIPESSSAGSQRSSLWRQADDGDWQLVFHQASKFQ